MAGVIGIGGIFIKFRDPDKMRSWYREVLGMTTNDYGVLFEFGNHIPSKGHLQLGTFKEGSDYFGDPAQQYMINFRVDDLKDLLEQLRAESVSIVTELQEYDYGKFIHIEDPEGNRIELWEPPANAFDESKETTMPLR